MGKRAPAGNGPASKPPGGFKPGGGASAPPPAAKKNPFDFFRHKPKHEVANARARTTNVAKSRSEAIAKVRLRCRIPSIILYEHKEVENWRFSSELALVDGFLFPPSCMSVMLNKIS